MAPDPGRTYTVGVSFEKLIPDENHKSKIRDAVERVHKATIYATELINIHIRRCFEELGGTGLESVCDANWLLNVYNEVTTGTGNPRVVSELRETKERFMPGFEPVRRSGLTQVLAYECRNLAAVAGNNVWMHFQKRLLSHVRHVFRLSEDDYQSLTKEQRQLRSRSLMQVARDLSRPDHETPQSPPSYHAWIASERTRLGIDASVGEWKKKPLLYHLKSHPERFLKAMRLMSLVRQHEGAKAFSVYPMRRTLVPRHIRIDQKALRALLSLGGSEHSKQAAKRRKTEGGDVNVDEESDIKKKNRRSKADLVEEKSQAFSEVLNFQTAKLRRRHHFDFAFTTDGICARLQCRAPSKSSENAPTCMPKRGIHAIDELKHLSRLEDLHVVGIDPGIREIIVAVDQDDPQSTVVRYTQKQRLRDLRSRQYADEATREKPYDVTAAEGDLVGFNSRAADLESFCGYCQQRRQHLDHCLTFYRTLDHRRRRWKKCIKEQQSEQRLYDRLGAMHQPGDPRTLVLAYGSWGAESGKASSCVKRGNPPTIGVGLMKKLSKRFVVSLTPEHHTSQTCCKCLGVCGAWTDKENEMGKKLRGLRICQDEGCKLPQNRDRMGASNIGLQFRRLFSDQGLVRQMTDEERELHRLRIETCEVCD